MTTIRESNSPLPSMGIDVSKRTFDACLRKDGKSIPVQFPNTKLGCQRLISWLSSQGVERVSVTMEATGWYYMLLGSMLHSHGHRVAVVNPKRIVEFAKSCGRRNKTDKADAAIIARYGEVQPTDEWQPMDPSQRALRDLIRRQEELEASLQAEKNRLEGAQELCPAVIKSIRRVIKSLERELQKIEEDIRAALKTCPWLQKEISKLTAIKGIGEKTARMLVAEIPRHFINARALCAWLGLTPRQCESGTSVRGRSRIGHEAPDLRGRLYWTAITAKNKEPRFREFAKRLKEKGKAPLSIAFAVLHKLMRCVYVLLKNPDATYDPNHRQSEAKCSP